jgi:hypothetical protein
MGSSEREGGERGKWEERSGKWEEEREKWLVLICSTVPARRALNDTHDCLNGN